MMPGNEPGGRHAGSKLASYLVNNRRTLRSALEGDPAWRLTSANDHQ